MADAIGLSLEMSIEEKNSRMQRMRRVVREPNVYNWAGNLMSDLCELRIEKPDGVAVLEHRA